MQVSEWSGIVLSQDKHFIEFEYDTFDGEKMTIWKEASDRFRVSDNEKGYKWSTGFLAIEVWTSLNEDY